MVLRADHGYQFMRARMPLNSAARTADRSAAGQRWAFSPWAAVVVLAAFYAVLLASVGQKSLTVDEPGHVTAGYIYWQFGDYRFDPENGNLPKRWFALPLLGHAFPAPEKNSTGWTTGALSALSDDWLHRSGHDPVAMTARGRAMAGLMAVGLAAAVWWWSRRIFGPVGAMISLLLCVLNPGVLANGALMTSDTASALFLLLSLAAITAMLAKASPLRVALSALALGVMCVVKLSAVVLVPVALILALVRVWRPRPLDCGAGRQATTLGQRAAVVAAAAVVHVLVAAGVIWAAHGFRFSAFAPALREHARFQLPWERVLAQPPPATLLDRLGLDAAQRQRANETFAARRASPAEWSHESLAALQEVETRVLTADQAQMLATLRAQPPTALPARIAAYALRHRLLPEAYLFGCAYAWSLSGLHPGFLNGETRVGGWRWFFPYTFLVKTPIALLALLVLAGFALWKKQPATAPGTIASRLDALADSTLLPLLVFSALYWTVSITSDLNIGHRHLLPIYPTLFILGGAICRLLPPASARHAIAPPARNPLWRFAPPALLALLAAEATWWFPHYLSYFNGFVLPSAAHRHLVDSSLDWGQDLPAVAHFLRRQPAPAPPTYLAYFGQADPRTYDITTPRLNAPVPDLYVVLPVTTPENNTAVAADFVHRNARYDGRLVVNLSLPEGTAPLLLLRPEELRLTAGTYIVSASFLQPLYAYAFGDWSPRHESRYRELRQFADPFLSNDPAARAAAIRTIDVRDWHNLWAEFATHRFARLTAFLRQRQPDEHLNYSILVYRLTPADLAAALDGPPPIK